MDPYKHFFDRLGIVFNYEKWPERFFKLPEPRFSLVDDALSIKLFKRHKKHLKQKDTFLMSTVFQRHIFDELNSPSIYEYVFRVMTHEVYSLEYYRLLMYDIDGHIKSLSDIDENIKSLFDARKLFPSDGELTSCEEVDLVLTLNGVLV